MLKTIKYAKQSPGIPHDFCLLTTGKGVHTWANWINTDNYILGELSNTNIDMNGLFYGNTFKALVKNRKNQKTKIKTYEWKEFLLFLFSMYQKTTRRKLIPRNKVRLIKAFVEDFQSNVQQLNSLDKKYKFHSKADKIFYIKKADKTYLLGFLFGKKLFITFPYIMNNLVDRYFSRNVDNNGNINNFEKYLAFFLYKEWGTEIKTEKKSREKVMLGADPEFLIYSKYKKNPKIADYRKLKRASGIINGNDHTLGTDGCDELGELRPPPSNSPYTLTRNIKSLFNKFYSEHGGNYFIETGGGCENSIGGHIHLGHELFKNLTQPQVKSLMQLLDAFLYFPIKLNMYGAVREWRDFNELDVNIDYYNGECKIDEDPEKIVQVIKKVKPLKSQQFNGFDLKSQTRSQPHGLEYRSLPSFIGDFTFTHLVLKLAKGIAEKYIELRTQGIEFTYNDPPQKEDYLVFLKEKEVKQLFEYLHGKKRDLFLKNTLENWKVVKEFYITIQDNLNVLGFLDLNRDRSQVRGEFQTRLTKDFQSTLKKINHSLVIYILASQHYFINSRYKSLVHPFFIITPDVNFSTMTKEELAHGFQKPDPYTIYLGVPQLWRDKGYINDNKETITQIITEAINVFHAYNKSKDHFKIYSLKDLKKKHMYNNLLLSQIAEDVNGYSKVFEKYKKKNKISQKEYKARLTQELQRQRVYDSFSDAVANETSVREVRLHSRVWDVVSEVADIE